MSTFISLLLYLHIVIGQDYIYFESSNYTKINATLKLPSSQQYLLPLQSVIEQIHNESYPITNLSKCIQINFPQTDDAIIYKIDFGEQVLVEIFQIQITFISNDDIMLNITDILIQTYDEHSKQIVTIIGSSVIETISNDNAPHTKYIYFWETDIPASKTNIPLSNTMELHIPIDYENSHICNIMIFGNVLKQQTVCLVGNTYPMYTNQRHIVQYFGTYKSTHYSYYITTKFKGVELDISQSIFTHILHDNEPTILYLFKLHGIGWVLADNIPFINIDKLTNIYLTCFCSECSITDCGINSWYLGYNDSDCPVSSIHIEKESCSKNMCMKNLTLITNNNQQIDISGNLIAKYNETDARSVYWENQNDSSLRWYLSADTKWIYGTLNYDLIICEPGYVEMPLFCTNWSYLTKKHSNWKFSLGNCDNVNSFHYENDIEKCFPMDQTPVFQTEPVQTVTLILIIILCVVGACLAIISIISIRLYHGYKYNFKYHLNERDEIHDAISNNDMSPDEDLDDDDDDEVCNDLIINHNTKQQYIINDNLPQLPIQDNDHSHEEEDDEDMYEHIKSAITNTSTGGTHVINSNPTNDTPMDGNTNKTAGNDSFKLTIPYYRSDRTTVVSMDGQEGSDSVKVWLITKVNIPSSNDNYISLLLENGYETLDIVKTITRNDLDEIGIVLRGHQAKILLEIEKLNNSKP